MNTLAAFILGGILGIIVMACMAVAGKDRT